MTIDGNVSAKDVADAIAWIRGRRGCMTAQLIEQVNVLERAASAYAATLPREVSGEGWGIISANGDLGASIYDSEEMATQSSKLYSGWHPIRLTGKAVLPRVKD